MKLEVYFCIKRSNCWNIHSWRTWFEVQTPKVRKLKCVILFLMNNIHNMAVMGRSNFSQIMMKEYISLAKAGAPSQYKYGLSMYGIFIINVRRSRDRLIFIMVIHIVVRRLFDIETVLMCSL